VERRVKNHTNGCAIGKLETGPLEQRGHVLFSGNREVSKYVAHHRHDSHIKKNGLVKLLFFLCSKALKIKIRFSFEV
jgi:hypothetical protein